MQRRTQFPVTSDKQLYNRGVLHNQNVTTSRLFLCTFQKRGKDIRKKHSSVQVQMKLHQGKNWKEKQEIQSTVPTHSKWDSLHALGNLLSGFGISKFPLARRMRFSKVPNIWVCISRLCPNPLLLERFSSPEKLLSSYYLYLSRNAAGDLKPIYSFSVTSRQTGAWTAEIQVKNCLYKHFLKIIKPNYSVMHLFQSRL